MPQPKDIRYYSVSTAIAVVVANMIGTGVFTSLGFQVIEIQQGTALLMLWVLGGLTALCGALCYAELGAALPRSGGEYHFLGRIFHPAAGFVSGWISATVGFAAPVALAAIAFGRYLSRVFPSLSEFWVAIIVLLIVTSFHVHTRRKSAGMQWHFTLIKLLIIAAFCLLALTLGHTPDLQQSSLNHFVSFNFDKATMAAMSSGAFAVSLIYVNYAYNGWNAAAYITNELAEPQKALPKILVSGTLAVMLAYVALNFAFLYSTPVDELAGQVEVAFVVALQLLGESGGRVAGLIMSLLLISTISAMTLAGPRVLKVMGEDYRVLGWLGKSNEYGIPSRAIYFQSALALAFIITGTFEQILIFSGLVLTLNNAAAVLGVIVLRLKQPDMERPFKVPLYPIPAIIFLGVNAWIVIYLLLRKTENALPGLVLILVGLVMYWLFEKRQHAEKL